jgi:CRP-like cAMP-binding protein
MTINKEQQILFLKKSFDEYSLISDKSWELIKSIVQFQNLKKGETVLREGQIPRKIYYISQGILRTYYTDDEGNIYTKNIFFEKDFAASKVSLLLSSPSRFTIEALENALIINIDYKKYRNFISKNDDLKDFYIAFIEKNWIIKKEPIEISLVMKTATERYLFLLKKHSNIEERIPLHYIASHLGITPTQLSRIRRELKNT